MKPHELFQVLIRVLGVWLLYIGISNLFRSGYFSIKSGFISGAVGDGLAMATPSILIGLYLLSGAKILMHLCYGRQDS